MAAITIVAIYKTPMASILGNPSFEIVYLDSLEIVVVDTPLLCEYFFSLAKNSIIKGIPHKRKIEQI
jgi:hypothetical protein